MSISSVSIPVRRLQVAPAAKARTVSAAAPVAAPKPAQPVKAVKAQSTASKHAWYPIIASIGTGVSALAGTALGMFACGMSDAPVSAFETFKMAGSAGLLVGGIGALVFFGGGAIIRSLTSK